MSPRPCVVATWPFGLPAVQAAARAYEATGSALDAVEAGIRHAELDTSVTSVGHGGLPNADGVLQVDATIMCGDMRAGGVMALEGCRTPICVARKVMERCPHVLLAGAGAAAFATQNGFPPEETLTPEAAAKWRARRSRSPAIRAPQTALPAQEWRATQPAAAPQPPPAGLDNHDTIGMIAVDGQGRIVAGCSTSGRAYKLAGRVGDSPIIGSGLYADDGAGAAVATGDGEQIMKVCMSMLAVEGMRAGRSAAASCEAAVGRLRERCGAAAQAGVLAVDKDGTPGAYSTHDGFTWACWRPGEEAVLHRVSAVAGGQRWHHVHPEGEDPALGGQEK
eukprot:tig00020563_g11304.t1